MSSHEDTASSEARSHACPRLCTPLEGLRAWDRLGGFSYAFLDDTTRRELARLDARALAHRVALARDGLLELLREQDIRASPWTEDVVRHASDNSDASESAPCESPFTTRREKRFRGQAVVVLAFPPGLDFLVAFLACEACAAVAVPVRPPDPTGAAERFAEERRALIGVATASGARLALTTRAYAAAFAIADAKRNLFSTLRAKKVAVSSVSSVSALPFAFVPLERVLRRRKRRITTARVAPTPHTENESNTNTNAKEKGVVAFVQFTSGSTGAPKGVVVGAEHVTTNCALIRARLGVTDEDSNVSWLPQFHDMGLVGAWLVPLTIPGGGKDRDAVRHLFAARKNGLATVSRDEGVVVAKKEKAVGVFYSPAAFARDPASWMRVASEYRATMTQGPDFAYRLCAMRFGKQSERNLKGFRTNEELLLNLSKLRSCLNASERAQHDTHFLFASTFASHGWNPKSMRAGYGLAESVVYVCDGPVRVAQIKRRALEETNEAVECAPFDTRSKELDDDKDTSSFSSVRVSSCGAVRVVSGDGDALDALDPDVRVVCPETHKELPDGRVGEIWVRGGSVAFGYVDEDGFSLGAAFGVPLATGKIWEKKKKGGYLRTGDVGFIDGVSGEVFVVGRMRDRFKVNGRAYSPEDIERVILDAKPGVFRRGGVAAFAFEEDALREKKQKKTIAFCTPATRVGVVAEVRDECLVHDPVAYARLLDDVREVVSVTHGLRLRRRDVALVRKGAAPKTSSGKKRRDETRKLFLDGYFFKKGVAVEGFSSTLFTQDNDFFAEEHRFGSMFLLDDTGLGEKTAREESSTELCAKTFLRRLAKKRGARFAARHVETCLRRFFATERFFVNPWIVGGFVRRCASHRATRVRARRVDPADARALERGEARKTRARAFASRRLRRGHRGRPTPRRGARRRFRYIFFGIAGRARSTLVFARRYRRYRRRDEKDRLRRQTDRPRDTSHPSYARAFRDAPRIRRPFARGFFFEPSGRKGDGRARAFLRVARLGRARADRHRRRGVGFNADGSTLLFSCVWHVRRCGRERQTARRRRTVACVFLCVGERVFDARRARTLLRLRARRSAFFVRKNARQGFEHEKHSLSRNEFVAVAEDARRHRVGSVSRRAFPPERVRGVDRARFFHKMAKKKKTRRKGSFAALRVP
jgi:acyl-CoA synthetase (AMP-forming)/AMP-acid ligase II